jgi:hypothetical protein
MTPDALANASHFPTGREAFQGGVAAPRPPPSVAKHSERVRISGAAAEVSERPPYRARREVGAGGGEGVLK